MEPVVSRRRVADELKEVEEVEGAMTLRATWLARGTTICRKCTICGIGTRATPTPTVKVTVTSTAERLAMKTQTETRTPPGWHLYGRKMRLKIFRRMNAKTSSMMQLEDSQVSAEYVNYEGAAITVLEARHMGLLEFSSRVM